MTRAELIAALRARFIEKRPEFPEHHERIRNLSGERLLESYCNCVGCGGRHFTPAELVERAEAFDDVDAFMEALQAIALERVPKRCLDITDRVHAAIMGTRN